MAEILLRREAKAQSLQIEVKSSGTHALNGSPSPIGARAAMDTKGISMDSHRSMPLTQDLIDWSDYVVALAADHMRALNIRYPNATDKIVLMSTIANGSHIDVDDPYGNSDAAYRKVCDEIDVLCTQMCEQMKIGAQK